MEAKEQIQNLKDLLMRRESELSLLRQENERLKEEVKEFAEFNYAYCVMYPITRDFKTIEDIYQIFKDVKSKKTT